jgi:hypothetical protein
MSFDTPPNEASFRINSGIFSRYGSIPILGPGFCKELGEDMDRVMDHYLLKHPVRRLSEENEALIKAMGDVLHHLTMNRKEVALSILNNALKEQTNGEKTH